MKMKNLTIKNDNAIINDIQRDKLNKLQIIRVITDTKILRGEVQHMLNFNLLHILILL